MGPKGVTEGARAKRGLERPKIDRRWFFRRLFPKLFLWLFPRFFSMLFSRLSPTISPKTFP